MSPPQERPPGRTEGRDSWAGGLAGNTDHTGVAHIDADQLTLEDELEAARRLRDDGVAAAASNTWTPWRTAAHEFVVGLPAGSELTSDAIVTAVGLPLGSRNATGAFVHGCIRSGLIEWTGRVAQSTRATRHGAWIKVYRRTGAVAA